MLKKSFSRGRRQPTPNPSQEGKTGEMGNLQEVEVHYKFGYKKY
ncbi:hypothetical protein [Okeania sp. SIO2C2]|nr:hypothetical protein [Okeania sp. SIO2C2]